ncbi:MAG: hypothetical protein R2747_20175 [Pyrinomonadaceae bacterium]
MKKNILLALIVGAFMFSGALTVAAKKALPASSLSGGQGLDLNALAELFKESSNVEKFELELNKPETGLNNLDLDENDEVDYIRVEEQVEDDTHLIVLQTQLAENEVQDVATIAVEKEDEENYQMQVQGDPDIYGENFYIVPAYRGIGAWPIVGWIYRPVYRPYRSVFGFRVYPRWWRPWRPVTINVYRTRTVRFVGRNNFVASKTVRVKTVHKVSYNRQTSTLVRKNKVVVNKGNTTVVKGSVKKTNNNGTTVKKGVRKTTQTKNGSKTKTKVKVKKKNN